MFPRKNALINFKLYLFGLGGYALATFIFLTTAAVMEGTRYLCQLAGLDRPMTYTTAIIITLIAIVVLAYHLMAYLLIWFTGCMEMIFKQLAITIIPIIVLFGFTLSFTNRYLMSVLVCLSYLVLQILYYGIQAVMFINENEEII